MSITAYQNSQDGIESLRADILLNTKERHISYGDWNYERLRRRCSSRVWKADNGDKEYFLKIKHRKPEKTLIEYKGLCKIYDIFKDHNQVFTPEPVGIIDLGYIQTIVMSWFEGACLPDRIRFRKYTMTALENLSEAYNNIIENRFLWKDARLDHVLFDEKGGKICLVDFENSGIIQEEAPVRKSWKPIEDLIGQFGFIDLWKEMISYV